MRLLLRVGQTLNIEDCRLKNEYSIVECRLDSGIRVQSLSADETELILKLI